MSALSKAELRKLKARAQQLKPILTVGKHGLSPQFLQALDQALREHSLLKVKFEHLKKERGILSPQLAESSCSHLVTIVGNVAVFYRPKPEQRFRSDAER